MDAELRFHLDQQIRDYMDRGLSRAEAERRARQEFGTLELAKDECRDQRSTEWLNHILRDVRHACRSLRKGPGFTAAVIATLALGIGANTAIFSLIYSVLLKPLPYPAADRVFSVRRSCQGRTIPRVWPMRVQDYLEWRQREHRLRIRRRPDARAMESHRRRRTRTPRRRAGLRQLLHVPRSNAAARPRIFRRGRNARQTKCCGDQRFALAPALRRGSRRDWQDPPAERRSARCRRHCSTLAAGPHRHPSPPHPGLRTEDRCLAANRPQ